MNPHLNNLKAFTLSKAGLLFNFFHIGLMKLLNIGSKYILVGYLIRVLGENGYGVLTWVDSIVQYFIMVINFGFDLYAAKHIVENKGNTEQTNKVISTIYYVKAFLFLLCFLLMAPLSLNAEISSYMPLILLMMLIGFGEVLTPIWFFQGIEKMKILTYITFFSKMILILGTFYFIKGFSDLNLYVIFLVVTTLMAGIWSYLMMKKEAHFRFVKITKVEIKAYLKEGYLFFLGKFSTFLFNMGTLFLIGYLFSKGQVAGFDIAIKIIFVFIIPFEVLQQALFPVIVRGIEKKWLQRITLATVLFSMAVSGVLYLFSDKIMFAFGGAEMIKYTYVLDMVLILIPIVSLTIIVGNCIMVAKGLYKEYNRSLFISGFLFLAGIGVLSLLGQMTYVNLIVVRVLTEILLLLIRLYHTLKNKLIFI